MKIVCIGDSMTYGYKIKNSDVWTMLLQNISKVQVLNKGIIGDSTAGMLSRFNKDVLENNPSHVIIMGGINDIIMDVPLGVIHSNIATIAHQARSYNIIPIIGIQLSPEPILAEEYWPGITDFCVVKEKLSKLRELIIGFGKVFDVQIIDFYGGFNKYLTSENRLDLYIDGLHLTSKGNKVMAKIITTHLVQYPLYPMKIGI